jgi:hypothetical protein
MIAALHNGMNNCLMDQKELYEKLLAEKDRLIALLEAQLAKK